jgi:hypothetical protein
MGSDGFQTIADPDALLQDLSSGGPGAGLQAVDTSHLHGIHAQGFGKEVELGFMGKGHLRYPESAHGT